MEGKKPKYKELKIRIRVSPETLLRESTQKTQKAVK